MVSLGVMIYKYDGIIGVNAVKLRVYFYAYHCVIFMGEFLREYFMMIFR